MSWAPWVRRSRRPGSGTAPAPAAGWPEERPHSRPVPELDVTAGDGPSAAGKSPSTAGDGPSAAGGGTEWNGSRAGPGPTNGALPPTVPPSVPPSVPSSVEGRPSGATSDDHHHPVPPFAERPHLRGTAPNEADVVAVVSPDGRLVFLSASAERLLGCDARDAVGRDAFGVLEAESLPVVEALFDDLIARRRLSVDLELHAIRDDGSELDLALTACSHVDDPVGGVVVTLHDITDQKVLGRRAGDVDRRQNALIESLADGILMVDASGTIVRVNEAFEVMFRAPRVRVLGRDYAGLLLGGQRRGLEVFDESGEVLDVDDDPVVVALRRGRRVVGAVIGRRRGDDAAEWARVNAQPIFDPDGTVVGAVASFGDVTESRRAAYALRQEEEFLRVLLDTLDEGIVACDAIGRITVFNPAARRLHGIDPKVEPVGRVPSNLMLRHPDGTPIDPEESPLLLAMGGERLRNVEIILAPHEGEPRKVSVNGQALVDEEGWKLGAVVAMHDVTEQKRNEERLADLAHHDPLTGLANRTLLALRMGEAVAGLAGMAASDGEHPIVGSDGSRTVPEHPGIAVYLLDLDDFKGINDEFGHDVGDDLLVAVARRLSAIVRPADTVARLGGDEFVVVCEIESGEEEMLRISRRISAALARPYRIEGRTLVAEASVGGVFVDEPDTDPSKLLSLADDAMYGVKWSRRRQRRSMTD